ncbi:MAG TPA: SdrD B-like domain-containing protein [Pyrinomonadaceae bacterium]|jgi:hypothetical protein
MNIKKLIPLRNLFTGTPVLAFFSLLLMSFAVKAGGTISGAVYFDFNMNGVRNTNAVTPNYAVDGAAGGVTVTVYAPDGTSKTTTTAVNGTYSINTAAAPALPAGPYRVEFTNLPAGAFPSAVGTNNATTVRFAAEGGASGVDLGIVTPKQYCQNFPRVVTNSYVIGTGTSGTVLSFPYKYSDELDGNINGSWTAAPSRNTALAPTELGSANAVGSTFGLSWNNLTNRVYAASYLKRGARFGSLSGESTGAIYQISNPTTAPAPSLFVDLNAVFAGTPAGANPHPAATTTDWSADTASVGLIGKIGLGGLKLSSDGATLYAVNLGDRRLYAIPTTGTLDSATVKRFDIPTTGLATSAGNCASGDVRPFALGRDRAGQIYVGAVCSAESTANNAQLTAYVWRFDNPGFTLVAANNLTFARVAALGESAAWQYWANVGGVLNRAAPMLSDIEFDGGDMILALRDRYGDQVVFPDYYRGYGDIMRACPSGGGNFAFESNGGCGGVTTAGAGTAAGNGGGEWFVDLNGDGREEGALGGLTQVPGFNHVIATFYDPVTYNSTGARVSNFYTAGIQRYSNATGAMTGAYDVYLDADTGNFGKADGLGDSEVLCEAAPLQIGNRVWNDANSNGVQDSNEAGIQNVALQLWADTNGDNTVDAQVGAATTDASGNYVFGGAANANMSTYACGLTGSVDKRVGTSSDDAEQAVADGSVSTTGIDLELTADGAAQQFVGVRFFDLNIPQGATITNARIEFTPRDDGTAVNGGNPSMTIRAQNADDAPTFAPTANNIGARPTTSASAAWSPANWTVGVPVQTPSIQSLVQEVVNRAGWQSGNSMAFVLSGAAANNFRRAWSFDQYGVSGAPRLIVQYTTNCAYRITPNTRYEVRLPLSNFAVGGALNGKTPTAANNDGTANGDSRDSDGVVAGSQVIISLLTGNYGENNHTHDFGFYVAPTAANASINGAVYAGGRGLGGVTVTLTGGNLTAPRTTRTSSFGYYYFADLPTGEIYVVTVSPTKKYSFANSSLIISLQDNIADANFEADEPGFSAAPKILLRK